MARLRRLRGVQQRNVGVIHAIGRLVPPATTRAGTPQRGVPTNPNSDADGVSGHLRFPAP
ncbi:MAG TPA: hypothetical protein VH597_00675 [Verrucomicrobiae bacterium]|nr:hypothetical protein [Verrucomicrobiae bacterium]